MIQTSTALNAASDTSEAARTLGEELRRGLGGSAPDAVMVFASSRHDPAVLLPALQAATGCETLAGASSAGEFIHGASGEGGISALALRSDTMRFSVGYGSGVSKDPRAAARQVTSGFKGLESPVFPHRAALVMTDALAGHADALVDELTLLTRGEYRFFGGGAGDDGHFKETRVFAGNRASFDAVVGLEIVSEQPLGIGVSHGWLPASAPMRVTQAQGSRLVGLNGLPAVDMLEAHARETGQAFDRAAPMPFFLHNILGIKNGSHYRLRVPLGIDAEGALLCAADVPEGSIVHVMKTSEASAVLAATRATQSALDALGGGAPSAALVFDCVATRLRMGSTFANELDACAGLLRPAGMAGCNTYGQIARAEGQFGGFHNCTAVVCAFPQ